MTLPGETEPADPTEPGSLAKWCKNAFDAALIPTRELDRRQRACVIARLSLRLIGVLVFGLIGAMAILSWLGTLERIPGAPDVIRPRALVSAVVFTFFIYLVALHFYVIFRLAKYGKATLQAIEYTYLFLGAVGLAAVASVGIERAGWDEQRYADWLTSWRSGLDHSLIPVQSSLCGQLGPRLPSIPTTEICQWMDEVKSLAHQPLDGNRTDDKERVNKLLEQGVNLDAKIPSAAKARLEAIIADRDKSVRAIPYEFANDLTENHRFGFRMFETIVREDRVKVEFDHILELGGQIAKIDAELKETQEALLTPKWFGFFLVAFAIALRITKLTIEAFGIGPR